jgi:hypothetical protein
VLEYFDPDFLWNICLDRLSRGESEFAGGSLIVLGGRLPLLLIYCLRFCTWFAAVIIPFIE